MKNLHRTVNVLVQPELVVGATLLLNGKGVDRRVAVAAGVGAITGQGGWIAGRAVGALDLEGDGLQAVIVTDGEVGDLDGGGGGDGEAGKESGGGEDLHRDWCLVQMDLFGRNERFCFAVEAETEAVDGPFREAPSALYIAQKHPYLPPLRLRACGSTLSSLALFTR
ncbi:hypothetical protein MPH_01555 [Macrophomina phaseolina MS6]|uniref:Uncharacterized protein n=1 Tax=Macrophomina phaseolina (strain MS6) TaxID=1126212 RepID=K2RF62_MACPH|nr:hypothetical protein MPH_01555 [Macrophomina phaseolina MS6]